MRLRLTRPAAAGRTTDQPDAEETPMAAKPKRVAVEEHYSDPDMKARFTGADATKAPPIAQRLDDLGELRLRDRDEAGIDIQVLSHGAPSVQKVDRESAVRLARKANDRLHAAVRAHPSRFAAFACLPTPDPKAAADELERCVSKLGFKGAMIHGLTNGTLFFDDKRFWPVFERAQALDVPLYMHPAVPHPAVIDAYYKDYAQDSPMLLRAPCGFTVEPATQAIRLVLSGVFDAYPKTKIILGHLGESLPVMVSRIDQALGREKKGRTAFPEDFSQHFVLTTLGSFAHPSR